MPMYESICTKCHRKAEYYAPKVTKKTRPCARCRGKTEMAISLPSFHDWNQLSHTTVHRPYVTRNIDKDGKPIEIRSHKQLEKECRKHGVTPAFGKENRIG